MTANEARKVTEEAQTGFYLGMDAIMARIKQAAESAKESVCFDCRELSQEHRDELGAQGFSVSNQPKTHTQWSDQLLVSWS